MKSPNFKTPAQIESKNLFGAKPSIPNSYFRKLNFDEVSNNPNFLGLKKKAIFLLKIINLICS